MPSALRSCGVFALLLALPAFAQSEGFGLGDGHDGPLTVLTPGVQLDSPRALAQDAAAGETAIQVSGGGPVAAGDLVMLVQVTAPFATSLDGGTLIDLHGTGAGIWELARVVSTSAGTLSLAAPLANAFPAARSQVVRVPEYTDVLVGDGGSIVARAWDGTTGGVVAFLATGTVTNDGLISATGAGFGGGDFGDDPANPTGCMAPDEPAPNGARKGAGALTSGTAVATGFGNDGNGGGGGVCRNSGGGGGGLLGAGGKGGFSTPDDGARDVGGRGGAAVAGDFTWLLFGGGGGAGHGDDALASAGASGGGAVMIRAGALTGSGVIAANGADAAPSVFTPPANNNDGAGGGGAGGSVHLRFVGSVQCGGVEAHGGNGGDSVWVLQATGPGGGGGGGAVLLQGADLSGCAVDTTGGIAGQAQDAGSFGAEPMTPGNPSAQGSSFLLKSPFDAGLSGGGNDAGVDGGTFDGGADGGLGAGDGGLDAGPSAQHGPFIVGCDCGAPGTGAATGGWLAVVALCAITVSVLRRGRNR